MSSFNNFEMVFSPSSNCERISVSDIQAFEKQLPSQLIEHWKERGLCIYGGGLLHFTNPRGFLGILDGWIEPKPKEGLVFLRTAFADIYFWDEGFAYALDIHYGRVSQISDDINLVFDHALCSERVQERSLRRGLYDEAVKRLGPPQEDECYAFVPALALGGPGTADSLQRVKLREHIELLRQLAIE